MPLATKNVLKNVKREKTFKSCENLCHKPCHLKVLSSAWKHTL